MSDAPERITVTFKNWRNPNQGACYKNDAGDTEYIRADLALPAVQPVAAQIDWHPIAEPPPNGPLLLWYGKADFLKPAGQLEPGREIAMRMEVGFCKDGDIFEAWTGHSMFEDWHEAQITHWAVHLGGPNISEGQQP